MIKLKIYSTAEMLEMIKQFPATLVRLADNATATAINAGDLKAKADVLFAAGNTCVEVVV